MEEDTVPEVFQPLLRPSPEMLPTFFQKIVDTQSYNFLLLSLFPQKIIIQFGFHVGKSV